MMGLFILGIDLLIIFKGESYIIFGVDSSKAHQDVLDIKIVRLPSVFWKCLITASI